MPALGGHRQDQLGNLRILGLSESTVNFHLRNACERLGVRGRRAAVAKALQEKLLDAFTASS